MQESTHKNELKDRLNLIESMIAEGRRDTEGWGWAFVLWGAAYYVAFAWSAWRHSSWAWPVTVSVAILITALVASLKNRHHPGTTLGRAVGSIWIALGISMFLLFLALGLSGRLAGPHLFAAVSSAILGMANGASALVLRWKAQLACAVAWWVAAVAVCFGSNVQSMILFLAAVFLCQIVFGAYAMIGETQERRRRGQAHA